MKESKKITIEESLEKLYALKKQQEKDLNLNAAAITAKIIKALEKRRDSNGSSNKCGASERTEKRKKV